MRTVLKIVGVLIAVILVILILALKRVDYSPYFETNYYSRTISGLDSLSGQLNLEKGKVQLGFGRASITPVLDAEENDPASGAFKVLPLAGYGNRKGAAAEGIHDSIFIKAAAIRVQEELLLIICADILIVPPNISEQVSRIVEENLGIKREQLIFSATHTHSSIGAWSEGYVGKAFAGEADPDVVQWLVQQYCHAIEDAVMDLKPGALGTGSFEASDFISNRLVKEQGEKNSEFTFIEMKQDGGKRVIIGSFGAHTTSLGAWNMMVSGDFPGYWQRKLENEGIDMAMYIAGSVGSQTYKSKGEKFEKAKYIGEALADSMLKYISCTLMKDSIGLSCLTLKMNLPELHIRVSDGLRLKPSIGAKLFPFTGDIYLQTARIGDLIWATTPCDFSGEMAIRYKNRMQKEGFRTLVSSFNGSYTGYIIPGKYYHMNSYESRLMSWYGPNMGPYTDELIRIMMQRMVSL